MSLKKNPDILLKQMLLPYANSRTPKTPEKQTDAKAMLLVVLRMLEDITPPSHNFENPFLYLHGLQMIFMPLAKGDFLDACNETEKYIDIYWEKGAPHDGLISILKKVKRGEFPTG